MDVAPMAHAVAGVGAFGPGELLIGDAFAVPALAVILVMVIAALHAVSRLVDGPVLDRTDIGAGVNGEPPPCDASALAGDLTPNDEAEISALRRHGISEAGVAHLLALRRAHRARRAALHAAGARPTV